MSIVPSLRRSRGLRDLSVAAAPVQGADITIGTNGERASAGSEPADSPARVAPRRTIIRRRRSAGWAVLFLIVVFAPLAVFAAMRIPEPPVTRLSALCGVLAVSLLLCGVVLSARLRLITTVFGLARTVHMHRYLGAFALGLVIVHVGLIVVHDPGQVRLLVPWSGTAPSRAATAATLALLGLPVIHRLRSRHYEPWRWLHTGLAAAALVLAGLHVYWLNHLVADPTMRGWFLGVSCLTLLTLGYRWCWRPVRNFRGGYVVQEVRQESGSVATVVVGSSRRVPSHSPALAFEPGQFVWLKTTPAPGAQEHPFSISSTAESANLEFTIRRAGDFTNRLTRLPPGARLWVDGPHGTCTPTPDMIGIVGIAAGIGITPLMSILRTLADRHDTRPHRLLVAARTEEDLLFRSELAALEDRLRLTVYYILSRPSPQWTGRTGHIRFEVLDEFLPEPARRAQWDYFICGPPAMVCDTMTALQKLRIPPQRVHAEHFS